MVRTDDVAIAHDHRIAVAVARDGAPANIPHDLGDALPRFSILNPTDPATSFRVRGTQVDVEVLTPLIGRERKRPIRIEAIGAAATPLRFLDYLIEETQPGAVVGGSGGKAWVTGVASSLARLDEDLISQLRRAGIDP